jgi:hypothetical protein
MLARAAPLAAFFFVVAERRFILVPFCFPQKGAWPPKRRRAAPRQKLYLVIISVKRQCGVPYIRRWPKKRAAIDYICLEIGGHNRFGVFIFPFLV